MNLISLLITIIIIAVVFGLVWWILQQMPLPEPFKMVVNVLIGLIAVLVLLGLLFGGINVPGIRLN
jgi:heme A synthase